MAEPVATAERWSTSIGKASWRALAASWLGWMFDGYESYALVLVMTPAVRQLVSPERLPKASIYAGGLLAATLLGWAAGGVTAGVLADYLGRRRTLMLSILCYAVFAGLAALSWNYWSLLIFRFLTGLGLGAEWGPGAAIVAEFWPPASRGRAGGALHSAYGFGLLLASGIWLLLRSVGPSSWRYMFVIGILPAFLLLYVRRWVDEPAIWIVANRGRGAALKRLEMGSVSPEDRELAQFTVIRILSDPELRRRVGLLLLMAIASVVPWWSASTWIPQYAAQLSTKLSSSLTGLLFSVGSIAGFLVMGLLADLLGRKPVIWLFYLGALLFSLCFFLLVTDQRALLIMAATNGFFASGQFAWMTIYLPETFPTPVRGTAMSLVFDTSRAVSVLCPLLAGWLISFWGGIGAAGAAMSLIYVVGLIVTPFAGPETKGKPLPA
ncbi:MAG: MFS transporter [Candidatus Acidiferrales bacterium]